VCTRRSVSSNACATRCIFGIRRRLHDPDDAHHAAVFVEEHVAMENERAARDVPEVDEHTRQRRLDERIVGSLELGSSDPNGRKTVSANMGAPAPSSTTNGAWCK